MVGRLGGRFVSDGLSVEAKLWEISCMVQGKDRFIVPDPCTVGFCLRDCCIVDPVGVDVAWLPKLNPSLPGRRTATR